MENSYNHQNNAKISFFYLLSLVALVFMALSTGMVIFQMINKFIPEVPGIYSGRYSSGVLKFAISSLVVSIPVYYVITAQIHKALKKGELHRDSAIRRWLTYFILFVTSVIMIVWVIMTINSFLDGELTLRFGLKFLTVLIIAGAIFSCYLYDIKRDIIPQEEKDTVMKIFFWGSLVAVVGVFVSSLFVVESPWEARARNLDREVVNDLSSLERGIDEYYDKKGELPADLEEVVREVSYMDKENIVDPETGEEYKYETTGEKTYELCSDFRTSSKEEDERRFFNERWSHDKGYYCFDLEAEEAKQTPAPQPAD